MDCECNSDLVGIDEQSSAKLRATHWIKTMAIIHPQTIPGREIDISPIFCKTVHDIYLKKRKEKRATHPQFQRNPCHRITSMRNSGVTPTRRS
jgi:hypothetical protein